MSTSTYAVKGMTCEHCVAAVTEEVSKISGVTDVAVDLDAGQVSITSDQAVSDDDVAAAVDEAGYELVPA